MKARHKKEYGGTVKTDPPGKMVDDPAPKTVYAGADSNVVDEAKERKKGGKVMSKACKSGGNVMGAKAMKRADRKPRASGGKLTSDGWEAAQSTSNPPGRDIVA